MLKCKLKDNLFEKNMKQVAIIVLAAGFGKRMKSDLPKVVHKTSQMALIQHVLKTSNTLNPSKVIVVTGYKKEIVEKTVLDGAEYGLYSKENISFSVQDKQQGTGDAVKSALKNLHGFIGTVLILYGDVPLTKTETLINLIKKHDDLKSTVSVVTVYTENPQGYGRIIRSEDNAYILNIQEHKDCNADQLNIKEINSGIYAVDSAFLAPAIEALTNDNAQGEYYLTDIIKKASDEGQTVIPFVINSFSEVQGVNTPVELHEINSCLRNEKIKELILDGVSFEDTESVYIDTEVEIATGVKIGANTHIKGKSKISSGVVIEGSAYLINTIIEKDSLIKFSVRTEDTYIGKNSKIGPFAHLRPGSKIGNEVKIGNFVETKNAELKDGVSTSHLTYLGDAIVGENSNIGAGTITCNYDGVNKFQTIIEESVFIGSNTSIIAPSVIKKGTFVGAGSVISKQTIPEESLAISRPNLVVKDGYMRKSKSSKSGN